MTESRHSSDSFVFKTDRPWPNARMKAAAIVGHADPTGARLWFRTGQPGEFSLLLYPYDTVLCSEDAERKLRRELGVVPLQLNDAETVLQSIRCVDFRINDYQHDTTHVENLENLDAGTRYGYVLYDQDRKATILGHNRLRSFRTPLPDDEMKPFQFAMFSCHMPYEVNGLFRKRTELANLEIWEFLCETLLRHKDSVELVIAGGDQCYSDGVDTLNIWKNLNRLMRKDGGHLLPDQESMLSWFRDIYRGYWGFESVQRIFENFPTYMIWDDHEICDGWGSHYLQTDNGSGVRTMLPDLDEKGLEIEEGRELIQRMFEAARQSYMEYQHSHNPPTAEGVFDYSFRRNGCGFYVLDGRGQRDVEREDYRILGHEQFERFSKWADSLDPEETRFAFVVSAVPVLHTSTSIVQRDRLAEYINLGDDLRDSWEHELHNVERKALMDVLFKIAKKGIKVAILSGDVHISAVFSIENEEGCRIYQLTSSAITYGLSLPQSLILKLGAADDGKTEEGYNFKRLALYTENSYALVSVDPNTDEAWFKLYGSQKLKIPDNHQGEATIPLSNSLAKIRLF